MSKFKIGDRVRFIEPYADLQAGAEGIVTGFWRGGIAVDVNDTEHCCFERRVELLPTFTLETGTFYRTRSGKPTGRVTVGDTGFEAIVDGRVRIYDAAGGHVHGDAELDIVEPWAPKVGERVRVIKTKNFHPAVTAETECVVDTVHGDAIWINASTESNGVLSQITYLEDLEPLPVAAPQPAALKLEAGKFYRTRDGRKVGPLRDDGCGLFGADGFNYKEWYENGRTYTDVSRTSPKDLIAEWQETTNVGAQVDTLAEEYGPIVLRNVKLHVNDNAAKPKFRVGDRVQCIDNRGAPRDFKVGEFYTVTAVEDDMVRCGDAGMFGYRFELAPAPWSGYAKQTSKFKVGDRVVVTGCVPGRVPLIGSFGTVTRSPLHSDQTFPVTLDDDREYYFSGAELAIHTPTAIVALIEDGKPKPADSPHVHANQAAAEREAKRLAGVHKGKQFGVYVLATTAEEPAPVYAHEWQRLAARGQKTLAIVKLNGLTGMGIKPAKDAVEYFLAAA